MSSNHPDFSFLQLDDHKLTSFLILPRELQQEMPRHLHGRQSSSFLERGLGAPRWQERDNPGCGEQWQPPPGHSFDLLAS